jgi:invasion protein IalB
MTVRRSALARWLIAGSAVFAWSFSAEAQQSPQRIQLAQAAGAAQTELLGQYDSWGAYRGNSGGRKVCFALGRPVSSQTDPPNRPRDPTYMYVSMRPTEKVLNEVSIIIGYGFKSEVDATVEIGSSKFAMMTQNDGAWIRNAAEEPRMVDAMRKSGELVVKGTSMRGTQTTDRYSLKGLGQALDRAAQECK